MLNLLLVIPRYLMYGNGRYVMPMGILCISAYIKRENISNVFTLNLNHHYGDEHKILSDYIKRHKIDVVGIGGLSGEYQDLKRITHWIHEEFPNITLILGGGIMTADPTTTMQAFPEVTFGIVGEGELTLCELLYNLSAFKKPWQCIKGLAFREHGNIVLTNHREDILNLDELPFPDYDGFDYGVYLITNPDLSDEGKRYSQVSIIGGRSCKYNCTFCFHPSGSKYRQRSLKSILSEIDFLVKKYDITYIALREELFATDNERVKEFCRLVSHYNFDWSIQLRIDNINEELVTLLRGTRCRYVFVGVESACDEVLKSMRKGITVAQIEHALDILHKSGINFRTGVIIGDSVETYDMACRTLDWFEEYRTKYRLYADMIIAFPGSTLYKRAIRTGIIPDTVRFLQDQCPIVNVSKMSDHEFNVILDRVSKINNRKYNYVKYITTKP